MTRETRIALLVGLAFIVLFGLVLGQRSLSLSSAVRSGHPASAAPARARTAPDIVVATMTDRDDRPALAPSRLQPSPAPAPVAAQGPAAPAGPGQPPPALSVQPPQRVVGPQPPAQPQPVVAVGPGPQPAPTTRPAGQEYTIQQGDTLIGIARKFYGRGHENEYLRIFQANRNTLSSVTALSVGKVLVIPALEAAPPSPRQQPPTVSPEPSSGKTYIVRKGDSLSEIARRTLGSDNGPALKRIMDANRDRVEDPDHLRIGVTLRIPS